jgi:signal transduction histidine kinase
MKANPFSYLFFLVFLQLLFCPVLQAQTHTDSALYYTQKIFQPTHHNDLVDAYVFFNQQHTRAVQNADTLSKIYNLYMLALIELDLGLAYESEQTIAQNLKLLDALAIKKEYSDDYLRSYNLLGRVYRHLQHPEQSKLYYLSALNYAQKPLDSLIVFNNIGYKYKELTKTADSAVVYFQKAHRLALKTGDSLQYARVLSNWFTLEALNDAPFAKDSLVKAARIRKKFNDSKGLYSSYRSLSKVHLKNNNRVQAQQYADSALQLAQNINALSYLKDAYLLHLEMNDASFLTDFLKLTDSMERLDMQQKNAYASLKYNVAREREHTLASQLEQERERVQKQRYKTLAVLLAVVFIFVFYIYRLIYKKSKLQEIYKTETRISKKVHDELANDVYLVMVKMQLEKERDEDLLDDLEHIYNKSRDISKEYQGLDVKIPFDEIISDLLSSYQSDTIKIIRRDTKRIDWNTISAVKKNCIYRVLQELMTNMKKHSKATLAAVTFSQSRRVIEINYSDNGVGSMLKKQNGLQNAENRIFYLNGSITFETQPGKGFKAKIIV